MNYSCEVISIVVSKNSVGSGRRMSTPSGGFPTNFQYQCPIHLQCFDGGTPSCSKPDEVYILPAKMITPAFKPWVKNGCFLLRLWIDGQLPSALAQRAGYTGLEPSFRLPLDHPL
jgi:hypothetical protein